MNIFAVDESPSQAAKDLCNKHVVKMIIESAQILSTTYRLVMQDRWNLSASKFENFPHLYKATHQNHPVVIWTLASVHNTDWVWHHLLTLETEYRARYGKTHGTHRVITELENVRWSMWNGYGNWRLHTPFVQCMPEQYRQADPVKAYRSFYINEKVKFARWLPRTQPPAWWPL